MTRTKCMHAWVPNDGHGGKPLFARPSAVGPGPELMRAVCARCGHSGWFTENQWNGFMPEWAIESYAQRCEARAQRAKAAGLKNYPPPNARQGP